MTYEAADEIENGGQTVERYHNVGASMRQTGLARHQARVRVRGAIVPVVVHRNQNIGKYSATDHSSQIMSRNHDGR